MQRIRRIKNIGELAIFQKAVSTPSGNLVARYHIGPAKTVAGITFGSGFRDYSSAFQAAINQLNSTKFL